MADNRIAFDIWEWEYDVLGDAKCALQPCDLDNFSLKEYHAIHSTKLKNERWKKLAFCLSALRKPESSDVILVCGDQEFYAHKIVLEASSPYFVAMFNTGLEEAKSGRILFKEMEPKILEIVLDFVYLGDVGKMNTEGQVKKVLASSHLMQLEDLFNYCCGALEGTISVENFSELWQIGMRYQHNNLTVKVMAYVQMYFSELSERNEFYLLSFDQVQALLRFLKEKIESFDEVLQFLVKWLINDPEGREKMAAELFAYVDVKLVSKECIRSLLQNDQVMKSSVEIANRMNELGVAVFLSESRISSNSPTVNPNVIQRKLINDIMRQSCKSGGYFNSLSSRKFK